MRAIVVGPLSDRNYSGRVRALMFLDEAPLRDLPAW
jgi:hypothetical protein